MGLRRYIPPIILLSLLFASCSRPISDEQYVRVEDCDDVGRFVFKADMDDSLYTYGLDLYFYADVAKEILSESEETELLVELFSPSSKPYEGMVAIEPSMLQTQSASSSSVLLYHYGEDLVPTEYGQWTLRLSMQEEFKNKYKVRGVGLRLIRNNNGSR